MASSIASYIINLNTDHTWTYTVGELSAQNEHIQIFPIKLTAVDKIGGILCCICGSTFIKKKDFECHFAEHNTGDVVYACVACQKQHSTYASYRNHVYLQHISRHKFPCPQCKKPFSKQTALKCHITAIHNLKCSDCDEKFTTKKDLEIHKIIHNKKEKGNPPYECINCKELIKSIDKCEEHMNNHCEVLYPCPICTTILPSIEEAMLHISIHFEEKTSVDMTQSPNTTEDSSIDALGGIMCCHCDLIFKKRADIDVHFMSEHTEKTIAYTCNICEKQYTSYPAFGNHCYLHIAKDKFQCDECHKLFPRLSLLVMHNLAFHLHGTSDKPFRCDKCIYGFESHYRLLSHKKIVHDEITFQCLIPQCSIKFNTPKELIVHQLEHKSCLDNWCRQCGLQFATRTACEHHLTVHRRKRYACPVCARQYHERYLTLKHLPKHFESVLHICKVCGKSYSQRNRLIEHATRSHSDSSRKFKCSHCDKAFARNYEREQHERVHTGAKPYTCAVCQRAFASYPNWTKHLSRKHAYDKEMIRQARESRNQAPAAATENSPRKTESGIESASSEISDVVGFSEDSADGHGTPIKKPKREFKYIKKEFKSLKNTIEPMKIENTVESILSITDTVNEAIERIDIDEDLDLIGTKLNETSDFITEETDKFSKNIKDLELIGTSLNQTADFITEETAKFSENTKDLKLIGPSLNQTADFVTEKTAKFSQHTEDLELIGNSVNQTSDFITEETAKFSDHTEDLELIGTSLNQTADFITEETAEFSEHTENLDMIGTKLNQTNDFITKETANKFSEDTKFTSEFSNLDDSSDIKAIVEHIDALSGGLELSTPTQHAVDAVHEGMMQFGDIIPVDSAFDSVPVYNEPQYYQPYSLPLEYGPDFNTFASEVYTSDIIDLNDHVLPHIDPLLTIKAQNAKLFVQNVPSNLYDGTDSAPYEPTWGEPIITKVYSYDEPNDMNRMYELNGDIC